MIRLKRAYVRPDPEDGTRVLVERLWPRGVKKEDLQVQTWLKEVSPSPELRRWYAHDPEKWSSFKVRYWQELASRPQTMEALQQLRKMAESGTVTLVYAAKDEQRNSAAALQEYLAQQ